MKSVAPIYGQDFFPGSHLYTRRPGDIVSEGIGWFSTRQEACDFKASHVLRCVDSVWGIESSVKGVELVTLAHYFDDPRTIVICREPLGMDCIAEQQGYEYGMSLEGKEVPYDWLGISLGFELGITLSHIIKRIPIWRRSPLLLHLPNAPVCSGFVSLMEKNTDRYKNIKLFEEWNWSRITPVMLYNHFPYKPFRYKKH